MTPRNIVFFGESGHGKSSVINMVLGQDTAITSSSATGCTFKSTPYLHQLGGHELALWDTAGLNEGDQGTVTDMKAVASLYKLLKSLEGGVSLLVFCIRAPRINDAAHKNWKLFREVICRKEVPIVVVVTHLENEEPMDDWWQKNEKRFREYEMNPCSEHGSGVACVTASKGKLRKGRHAFQDEYEESQSKVRELIVQNHLHNPRKLNPVEWFQTIVEESTKTDCWGNVTTTRKEVKAKGRGVYELASRWGISDDEAEKLAKILDG